MVPVDARHARVALRTLLGFLSLEIPFVDDTCIALQVGGRSVSIERAKWAAGLLCTWSSSCHRHSNVHLALSFRHSRSICLSKLSFVVYLLAGR
jgi:hypothetical protein